MSNQLLLKLEDKIHHALEVIESLRLQLAEAEANAQALRMENAELQNRQLAFEQSLTAMLRKLSNAHLSSTDAKKSEVRSHSIDDTEDMQGMETRDEERYAEALESVY